MAADPESWPYVADDLFRMAHQDTSGAPFLHPAVAGIGLAAALLGELVLACRVAVDGGRVVVLDHTAPVDVLAHSVLDQLVAERSWLPVSIWLAYLGTTALEAVAQRLLRASHLRMGPTSRRRGRSPVYVPTKAMDAYWPTARLVTLLRSGTPLTAPDLLLAALMMATGLDRRVLDGAPPGLSDALRHTIAITPAPELLIARHADVVIGEAVRRHAH